MTNRLNIFFSLLVLPLLICHAGAEEVVLRQGDPDPFTAETYTGAEDLMIVQNNDSNGQTDQNFGGRNRFFVGGASGQLSGFWPRRAALRFDLSSFAGQYGQINSVVIRLVVSESLHDGVLQVFRMADANADWVEGTETGAGPSDPPDVGMSTWRARIQGSTTTNSVPWASGQWGASQAGVDYTTLMAESIYDDMTTGVVEIVLDADEINELVGEWTCGVNAGLFLRVEGVEQDNEIQFHSREADDIELRPQLIIDYEPPMIGDVNLDGQINLLDVSPFVDSLTQGIYQPNADVNSDCSVDLLDVSPFIDLLSGG